MEKNVKETPATAPQVVKMPEQNGITMPRPGTACANLWDLATKLSTEAKATIAIGDLLVQSKAAGYNDATTKTQYARWRKFHGVEGRVESETARVKRDDAAKAKAEKEAAKAAAKQAKLDAKASKEKAKLDGAAAKLAEKEAKAKEKAEAATLKKAETEKKALEAKEAKELASQKAAEEAAAKAANQASE